MIIKNRSERGQVLVLLVVGIVVLLGFTALAIDGGMLYSDRRYDQSVADSAALAGTQYVTHLFIDNNVKAANFGCTTPGVWVDRSTGWSTRPFWLGSPELAQIFGTAEGKASENNITVDTTGADPKNRVEVRCGGSYFDVKVVITTTTKTSFAHLLFGGTLRNTVTAIARTQPNTPGLMGYSLYATDNDCTGDPSSNNDGGIDFSGGGTYTGTFAIDITGGGAFTRSCLNGNNMPHSYIRSNANSCYDDPASTATYDCGTDGTFDPPAQVVTTDPLEGFYVDFPNCNDPAIAPPRTVNSGDTVLQPGYYQNVNLSNITTLNPGLYCIDVGNNQIFNRVLHTQAGNGFDEGVTIVFLRDGAQYKYTGQTDWIVKAAKPNGHNAPHLIPGVVMASKVEFLLDLNGDAMAQLWGTVYMPEAHLILGGTPTTVPVASQIIVHDLKYNGTGTMNMMYDDSWFFQHPPTMSLNK